MLGEIIGAVGSILGGAMGGDSSTKSKEHTRSKTTSSSVNKSNLSQLVAQAEKNGFNPLTVLRAGGLSTFSRSSGISRTNSKSKGSSSSSSSAPLGAAIAGAAQSIGGAISAGGSPESGPGVNYRDAWAGNLDPVAAAQSARDQETDLVAQQLRSTNDPGAYGVDNRLPARQSTYNPKPALGVGPEGLDEYIKPSQLKSGDREQTDFTPTRWGIELPPGQVNASAAEDFAGELGEFIMGGVNIGQTIGYNARRLYDYNIENNMMGRTNVKTRPDPFDPTLGMSKTYGSRSKAAWDIIPAAIDSVIADQVKRVETPALKFVPQGEGFHDGYIQGGGDPSQFRPQFQPW